MVAGGVPTLQVLLDDGTGAFPYDITTYARLVEGYSCKRGRQDELSSPTPGEMTLVLDNTDGRFTLGSTTIATPSPIQIDQKIRVKVTPNVTTVTRFAHAVNSWPVEWPNGSDLFSVAQIAGVDAQAKAERRVLRSIVEEEILADTPVAYFTLSEPAGSTAVADSSGQYWASSLSMVGSGTDIVFGSATGSPFDGLTAAQFAAGKYLAGSVLNNNLNAVALEAEFVTSSNGVIARLVTPPDGSGNTITLELSVVAGKAQLQRTSTTGTGDFTLTSTTTVTDGLRHHVGAGVSNLFLVVDGVTQASTASFGTVPFQPTAAIYIGGAPGAIGFTGTIAHVAVVNQATTFTRIQSHATATITGFAGESGVARLTRLAGYTNVPIGTLDSSLTNVPFVNFSGSSAMSAMQDVADAEMGTLFFDGAGNLTFHNRNRAVAKTSPDVTIDANFLAEGSQFVVDMQGVLNYYETTAAGTSITQIVRNTTSELGDGTATHPGHGRYPAQKTFLVQTDAEALDRANWIVGTHAEPLPRVGQLAFDVLTMTKAQQDQVLTLEPDSWLQVTGLPGQTPGGTTADFIVEGWSDALNAGEWTLTINAANKTVAAPGVWILDDATWSVLGTTTKLYV